MQSHEALNEAEDQFLLSSCVAVGLNPRFFAGYQLGASFPECISIRMPMTAGFPRVSDPEKQNRQHHDCCHRLRPVGLRWRRRGCTRAQAGVRGGWESPGDTTTATKVCVSLHLFALLLCITSVFTAGECGIHANKTYVLKWIYKDSSRLKINLIINLNLLGSLHLQLFSLSTLTAWVRAPALHAIPEYGITMYHGDALTSSHCLWYPQVWLQGTKM